jgi:outer membrane lipoprotein-sorting protein
MSFVDRGLRPVRWFAVCVVLGAAVGAHAVEAQGKVDLDKVLRRLDESAASFKSAEADMTLENTQTQPIQEKNTQTGTVILQRKGGQLSMSLHLKTYDGKPALKDAAYNDGEFKLYDPSQKQLQIFKAGNRSDIDTYLAVGFGGSGKDLEKNWVVTYAGQETVAGVNAAKLEMTPKQESVKANYSKVWLWIDMEKGLAVKQQSFASDGSNRAVTYSNLRANVPVPSNAFQIKTAPGTQIVTH